MSQETDFPTKPFYIQSKIAKANWALTVEGNEVKMRAIQGTVDFLWTARKDARGGSVLTNIGSGLVLTAQMISAPGLVAFPGGPLLATPYDSSASNQLFRAEVLDGNWRGINCLLDWEAKVNVYGSDPNGTIGLYHWDGGADNEEWLTIEESAQVETQSIQYHTDLAKVDLSLPPTFSIMTVLQNPGENPLTGSQQLESTVTESRTITNQSSDTTGQKYTQTFGLKGGIDKVFEVSVSGSFEESSSTTISFADQTMHTTSAKISLTVAYNVPSGKKYGYQIVVYYGKCDVPYTAQMTFQSALPGSTPVQFSTEGVFTGVNQIRNEVAIKDLTDSSAPTLIAHVELPIGQKVPNPEGETGQ